MSARSVTTPRSRPRTQGIVGQASLGFAGASSAGLLRPKTFRKKSFVGGIISNMSAKKLIEHGLTGAITGAAAGAVAGPGGALAGAIGGFLTSSTKDAIDQFSKETGAQTSKLIVEAINHRGPRIKYPRERSPSHDAELDSFSRPTNFIKL